MATKAAKALQEARRSAEKAAEETEPSATLKDIVFGQFEDVEATLLATRKLHPRDVWSKAAEALEAAFRGNGIDLTVNPTTLKTYFKVARAERRAGTSNMLAQVRNMAGTRGKCGVAEVAEAAGDGIEESGTGGAGEARDAREEASSSHSADGCPATPRIVPPLKIPGRTDKDRAIASIRERLDPKRLSGGLTPVED